MPRNAAPGPGGSPGTGPESHARSARRFLNAPIPPKQDALTPLERQRFARDVARLHGLGPRPIGELLLEIVRRWSPARRAKFLARLARYAALDPALVRDLGGDRFPPAPLREVPR